MANNSKIAMGFTYAPFWEQGEDGTIRLRQSRPLGVVQSGTSLEYPKYHGLSARDAASVLIGKGVAPEGFKGIAYGLASPFAPWMNPVKSARASASVFGGPVFNGFKGISYGLSSPDAPWARPVKSARDSASVFGGAAPTLTHGIGYGLNNPTAPWVKSQELKSLAQFYHAQASEAKKKNAESLARGRAYRRQQYDEKIQIASNAGDWREKIRLLGEKRETPASVIQNIIDAREQREMQEASFFAEQDRAKREKASQRVHQATLRREEKKALSQRRSIAAKYKYDNGDFIGAARMRLGMDDDALDSMPSNSEMFGFSDNVRQGKLDAKNQAKADRARQKEEKARAREQTKRDRAKKVAEAKALKASEKNTKALLGLSRGLGSLRSLGVYGDAISAVGHIVSNVLSSVSDGISSGSRDISEKSNFTSIRSLKGREAAVLSEIGGQYGIDEKTLMGFAGQLSGNLAASKFRITDFERNAAFWNLNLRDANGNPVGAFEAMKRISAKSKELSGSDREEFFRMMQINNENVGAMLIGNNYKGTYSQKTAEQWGEGTLASGSKALTDRARHVAYMEAKLARQRKEAWGRANFGSWSGVGNMLKAGFLYATGWTVPIISSSLYSARDAISENGGATFKAANSGAGVVNDVGVNNRGNNGVTVNVDVSGQTFDINGGDMNEVKKVITQDFPKDIAKQIIQQLQIYGY